MAILKYTDSNGVTHGVNSYKINPVIVAQEKGTSETAVMSQKAVSQADAELSQKIDTEVEQLNQSIGQKANTADVYSKTEVDSKVSAANTAINSKLPIDSFNEWSETVATKEQVNAKANAADVYGKDAIDSKVDQLNTAIGSKAAAADTYTKTEIDTKVDELNEAIGDLEAVEIWDAGTY